MVSSALLPDEIRFLYRKYVSEGFKPSEANEHIDEIKEQLRETKEKMKKLGKSDEDIRAKFREEFYKLCEESGR